jgi:outer membrane protein assembly factor BamA
MDGWRLRLAVLQEARAFGSDVSLAKLSADVRAYPRLGNGALALRAGFGATLGRPSFMRSFSVGGFADDTLRDVVRTNLTVLRGYPDRAFSGRSYLGANVELRLPLGHPQRGLRSLPAFARHLHAAAFVDAGHAWSGPLRLRDVRTGVGAALGADMNLGHALPVTFTAGVARGLADRGETRVYFRAGLAF